MDRDQAIVWYRKAAAQDENARAALKSLGVKE
jgi:TPR repeat protein